MSRQDSIIGTWRMTESEIWDRDALDLVQPAHVTLDPGGLGSIGFVAVEGGIDYRCTQRDGKPCVEFSWEGVDEGDQVCGRAWGFIDGDRMEGRLFIHFGDETSFVAVRQPD